MAFQTLNINGRIRMNSRVMNENGREGWTEKTYYDKNQEKGNHYNFARSSRNFELTKGCRFAFLNDGHVPIEQRLDARLAELGFHYYKDASKNAPYSCVDIIVGGDHNRMCELDHDFSQITRWARDNYRFFAEKFGEENIISFVVHLDETTPHAHVLAIPTALKKQRGRVKPGEQRKTKEVVSFKAHFGDLSKANSRKAAFQKWHDEYYQAVGKKWGFERGRDLDSMSPEERAEHTHLHKTELDTRNRLRAENKALQEQKNQLMGDVKATDEKVDEKRRELSALSNTILVKKEVNSNLDSSIIAKDDRYNSLNNSVLEKESYIKNLDNTIAQKEEKEKKLEEKLGKLEDRLSICKKEISLVEVDAKKKILAEMRNILFGFRQLKKTPEEQKKDRAIVQLAACLYLHLPKTAQKILDEINGHQVVFPIKRENDIDQKRECMAVAEKLVNLPKIEQEQERGHGLRR